ncbi:MAG: HD domain-containing protein [Saprospiraceae bacterium]|nr:HD domain-containing protein [Saprospiraceae bacterium]
MSSHKIFNDPIYGFISVPSGILMNVIEHPYFQRLRRIKQLGFTHYVYPGAVHTRFNHALGAFHLMSEALYHLQQKGNQITAEEKEAAQLAILLHDIGHGPFSHVLEHSLINAQHESITLWMMNELNKEFNGSLNLCIELFQGLHPKKFLHQLISSQLDVDRLDYLKRDSFYTGVVEGNIGIDRLIMMMDVVDNELVLEEKAIYTVEKFLSSRRIMYLQVYLHKTALIVEKMLKKLIGLLVKYSKKDAIFESIEDLMNSKVDSDENRKEFIRKFVQLDDNDIWYLLKKCSQHDNPEISELASAILNRKLYKVKISEPSTIQSFENSEKETFIVDFKAYDPKEGEILILNKNSSVRPLSSFNDFQYLLQKTTRVYTIQ